MATMEVKVPDIGDFKEVEVIEILVKPGDVVAVEQSLVTVESDKASMEIPSSAAGVVKALRVKLGDKVSEGSVLLDLEADASDAGTASAAQSVSVPDAAKPAAAAPASITAAPATASYAGTVDHDNIRSAIILARLLAPAEKEAAAGRTRSMREFLTEFKSARKARH